MSTLIQRYEVTQKTMDKFKGQTFAWRTCDCVKMTRTHLIGFGHSLPMLPRYRDALTAVRALKSKGWDNLSDMLDEFLPRINPASMLIGDIAVMDSGEDDPLECIVISAGQNVMGFHEDSQEAVVIVPHLIKTAWSVTK